MKLQADLREFVGLLLSRKVDFVVVGAHAVAFHGHPRATQDMDLLVRPSIENGQRIVETLKDFGFGDTAPDRRIQLGRPPNRIDLLTGIFGLSFDEAWSSRVPARLDGLDVFVIGREALIKNKRATGRTQDLADVEKLERRSS